jgi:hypothetical protein
MSADQLQHVLLLCEGGLQSDAFLRQSVRWLLRVCCGMLSDSLITSNQASAVHQRYIYRAI